MKNNGRTYLAIVFSLLLVSSLLVIAEDGNAADDDGYAIAAAYSSTDVTFAGGDGTDGDPYQIEDVTQLQAMQNNLSAHYVLTGNIDASVTADWNDGGFKPIASIESIDPDDPDFDPHAEYIFQGSFDGDDHVISDLHIDRPNDDGVGLFGIVAEGASVGYVGLEDVKVSGGSVVGSLAAVSQGTVQNSYATGELYGDSAVGGLIGVDSGVIENCSAAVDVAAATSAGGLVGMNEGDVTDCYATGDVEGEVSVGGLIGIHGSGDIVRSHAKGDVSGDMLVGGLMGMSNGTVSQSYAIGDVTIEDYMITAAGGLIAASDGQVNDSYATGNVVYEEWDGDDINAAALGGLLGINDGTVYDSYSVGSVSGEAKYNFLGGLVGLNESFEIMEHEVFEDVNGEVHNSFWNTETSGMADSAGGEGKNTAAMKTQSTFEDTGWDFENTWELHDIFNHGHPHLQWQFDENNDALVVGSVEDDGGDPVPSAAILVNGMKVGATNHDGEYFFVIDDGEHHIEAVKDGYESQTTAINAQSGDTAEAETMTVEAEEDPAPEEDEEDGICFGILPFAALALILLPFMVSRRR